MGALAQKTLWRSVHGDNPRARARSYPCQLAHGLLLQAAAPDGAVCDIKPVPGGPDRYHGRVCPLRASPVVSCPNHA